MDGDQERLAAMILTTICLEVGPGVLSTLAAISDTFADTATLVKKYGLKFEKKNEVCDAPACWL